MQVHSLKNRALQVSFNLELEASQRSSCRSCVGEVLKYSLQFRCFACYEMCGSRVQRAYMYYSAIT
eukprot:IDg16993t1